MSHTEKTHPELTKAEVIAAATNDPALSPDEFMFGGRKFKVLHLKYRQYMQFIDKLAPLFSALASKLTSKAASAVNIPGINLSGSDFNAQSLLKICADDLPAMVAIVCNMQAITEGKRENEVTAEWVIDHAEDPFQLVEIVTAQINKNNMIVRFASFFLQMLPLYRGARNLEQQLETSESTSQAK